MAETTTHTPTPWRVDPDDGREIYDQDMYDSLASVWKEADAAFIVRAVNAHDGLVAALKETLALVRLAYGNLHEDTNETQDKARAALAKAEGAPLDLSTAVEG